MNSPRNNPSEIKDRLSAELEARLPEREALFDEASSVFNEFTMLEDCPAEDPGYLEALQGLRAQEAELTTAKESLPEGLSHLRGLDLYELKEAIQALWDDPNYGARPADERATIHSFSRVANKVLDSKNRIDYFFLKKSGGQRRMAQAKRQLAKPNLEDLAIMAQDYSAICDLVDRYKVNIPNTAYIAQKVEEFNTRFMGLVAERYFGSRSRFKPDPKHAAFKAKMQSSVETYSNHGITVQLCTKLDGWEIALSYAPEYHDGVAKEAAERHALRLREEADEEAKETRDGTSDRVRSVYSDGGSSSSGREKA